MDCTHFRRQHLAYLDDTLPGDLMAAAQRHVLQCAACAAHDTRIRRSLMVARSLPAVVPRADFRARLDARLAECRNERVRIGVTTLLGTVVLIRIGERSTLPACHRALPPARRKTPPRSA